MELEKAINLLIKYWESKDITIVSKPARYIESVQKAAGLQLPIDFKTLYYHVNGMEALYPNETDKEGFLFYPTEAIVSIDKEFKLPGLIGQPKIYIFANYLHKSWWYGVEINDNGTYEIGIIPDKGLFTPITNSLAEFIRLYLDDSSKLYNY